MIVHHFNTYPHGGAANAAARLHAQMMERGVTSRLIYRHQNRVLNHPPGFESIEFRSPPTPRWYRPFQRQRLKSRRRRIHQQYDEQIAGRDPAWEVFSMADLPEPTRLVERQAAADIIHLHWISFLADFPSFFQSIPSTTPIVWTLHDMNPFTGGCHYSQDCTRFRQGCGVCPQIVGGRSGDVSVTTFESKRLALRGKRIAVVAPSQWMIELAESSPIWPSGTTFDVIRLGFELDRFRPLESREARRQLGISSEAILIGFGADDIHNQRKGFQHLLGALRQFRPERPVECLVLGGGQLELDDSRLPRIHGVGYLDTAEALARFYSACDLVVVPSREDNQPQIGLEAMACGRPVVAFDAGGIREYVIPNQTGYLADRGDEMGLARQIERMVADDRGRKRMGRQARRLLETQFEIGAQTTRYVELYQQLLAPRKSFRPAA